jgi:hypothetical protein
MPGTRVPGFLYPDASEACFCEQMDIKKTKGAYAFGHFLCKATHFEDHE